MRSTERHTDALRKLSTDLDTRKPEDEWLEQALDEAAKGVCFHEQQLRLWSSFSEQAAEYVEAVKEEAEELAMRGKDLENSDKCMASKVHCRVARWPSCSCRVKGRRG